MKHQLIEVNVWVTGIKRRARKPDRHHFQVWEGAPEHVDRAMLGREAEKVVRATMRSLHPGSKVTVTLLPVTVEDRGDGLEVRSFQVSLGEPKDSIDLTETLRDLYPQTQG